MRPRLIRVLLADPRVGGEIVNAHGPLPDRQTSRASLPSLRRIWMLRNTDPPPAPLGAVVPVLTRLRYGVGMRRI